MELLEPSQSSLTRTRVSSAATPTPLDYQHHAPNRYEWELEAERARMLRRRFLWFTGTLIVISVLLMPSDVIAVFMRDGSRQATSLVNMIQTIIHLVALGLAFRYARAQVRKERKLYTLAFWIVVGLGLLSLLNAVIIGELAFRTEFDADFRRGYAAGIEIRESTKDAVAETPAVQAPSTDDLIAPAGAVELPATKIVAIDPDQGGRGANVVLTNGILQVISLSAIWWVVFLNHFLACLFLPWTVKEAWRPAAWLLCGAGLVVLLNIALGRGSILYFLGGAVFLPISPLPGLGWCWWRNSRFRTTYRWRFESNQLRQLHQELDGARKIHEASLPLPQDTGPLRLSYVYEPMQQIGGDLLFVHPRPPESNARVSLTPRGPAPTRHTTVLLDVTGHGIAAALTVNRLVGELERIFAENPDIACADVMAALNRYVYLTLATYGVFVTGLAVTVETGEIQRAAWRDPHQVCFSSAGHPTAFVRRANGAIEALIANATMLGVLPPEAYDIEQEELELFPGDGMVIYTDGAIEAMNDEGEMIGIEGVRELIERAASGPAATDNGAGIGGTGGRIDVFDWPDWLIRRVAAHRNGPPADDTLIAVIYRPDGMESPPDVPTPIDAEVVGMVEESMSGA